MGDTVTRFVRIRPVPQPITARWRLLLTPRQSEVIRAMFREGSVKDAARALGIKPVTVKNHLIDIHRRLGVENTYEAAYRLWGWGEG